MKASRFTQVALAAVAIGAGSLALTPNAQALPFKPDCRSMAQYATAMAGQQSTNGTRYFFHDFSGPISKKDGFSDLFCEGGFIVESSPKGTLVCDGYLNYTEDDKVIRWASGSVDDLIAEIKANQLKTARLKEDRAREQAIQERRAQGLSTYGLEESRATGDLFRQLEDQVARSERPVRSAPCRWK